MVERNDHRPPGGHNLSAIPGNFGIPPEPDWRLTFSDPEDVAAARGEWGIILREMQEAGTVTVANGHAIRRLVEFRLQYERAGRVVAEHGAIIEAKRTRVPQINPHWVVMRQADDALKVLEAELGISPVRRARAAKAKRAEKTQRGSDSYLKSVRA